MQSQEFQRKGKTRSEERRGPAEVGGGRERHPDQQLQTPPGPDANTAPAPPKRKQEMPCGEEDSDSSRLQDLRPSWKRGWNEAP